MDLALKPEDEAFAASFRDWLARHLERPPAFVDLADEVAWGRQWQATLAADHWVGVHWPSEYGGRSATPVQVALYQSEYARSQAPQPVNRVGINLVGPTLLAHGSDDQRLRYLPAILSAEEIWCQLFSEPDAGSDLASLSTRAVPVEGGYVLTGRKVWTSYAQFATWGLCLARTDPEAARPQQGISALIVDMADPGTWSGSRGRAGRSPVPPWPMNGAPTSRSRSRWCTRPIWLASTTPPPPTDRWTTRWWPTRWPSPTSSWVCCGCTTCARSPAWGVASNQDPSRVGSSCSGRT
jgi:alkylation response protein AidB-like acyl-CoA dehydrogenase